MGKLVLPGGIWTKQPQYPAPIKQDSLSSGLVMDFHAPSMRNLAGAAQPSLVGNSTRTVGTAGKALEGAYQASNNYVNLGRPSITNNQITIEALVMVNAFQTNVFPYISGVVSAYQSDGASAAYAGPVLRFNPDATAGNAAIPTFLLTTGNGATQFTVDGPALSVGVLYHILATYDGSVATLFVDGIQVAQATHSITFDYHASTYFSGLSDYTADAITHNRCLNGKLFAARIYNKSKIDVAKKLAANLWQIYQPQQRKLYVAVAATAASGDVSVNATGVTGTSALGTVTVTAIQNASTSVTGVTGTSALGTVTVTTGGAVSVNVTGVTGTSALGTVTVTAVQNASASVTGVTGTSALGSVTVDVGGSVSAVVTGVTGTSALGTVAVTTVRNVSTSVTGVTGTSALGTATVLIGGSANASVDVTGVTGTMGLGSVLVWGLINTSQTPSWVRIPT